MLKIIFSTMLIAFSLPNTAYAQAFEQCSSGNANINEETYKLYGKAEGEGSKDFLKPLALIKICVTSENHKAGFDIWGANGNYINGGLLKLYGPKSKDITSKSCWMGPATRVEFQSLEFDKTQKVCVKGFISPQKTLGD